MKTTVPLPGSCVLIDMATLAYFKITKRNESISHINEDPNLDVTVVVPAYNEERWIKQCIEAIFNQTKLPKKVIVVDDCSNDKTSEICLDLLQKYENLVYIRQNERFGKAHNLNHAVSLLSKQREFHSPILICIDGDVVPRSDFIEKIQKPFALEGVAAVTGMGATIEPQNFIGKIISGICRFMFSFYGWQKIAQSYRNAVTPVCGGCVAYRTDILKKIPFRSISVTEDTDHTWLLLENKYKVLHFPDAVVDCEEARTFRGFLRQWFRWYSGTHQGWHIHGRKLLSAKKLFFTTLLPSAFDAWIYSISIFLTFFSLLWELEWFVAMIAWDIAFTACLVAIFSRRELKYLPAIWAMRIPLALVWITSGLKTLWERLKGKQHSWTSRWERPDTRHKIENKSNPIGNVEEQSLSECQYFRFLLIGSNKMVPAACVTCRKISKCIKKRKKVRLRRRNSRKNNSRSKRANRDRA